MLIVTFLIIAIMETTQTSVNERVDKEIVVWVLN